MPLIYHGPIPHRLWDVLLHAHHHGISVQSNFARSHAPTVALAASLGWLTSIDPGGRTYSGIWRITVAGLTALHNKDLMQ